MDINKHSLEKAAIFVEDGVLANERPLGDDDSLADDPPAADMAQADELWEQLLELCPPAHHDLLRLKRQGASLAEIAARTGLHPSSVRRILYDLARRLADQQALAAGPPEMPR